MKRKSEYSNFDRLLTDLLRVPHSEILTKLKQEKEKKRKKSKHSSASREASDRA